MAVDKNVVFLAVDLGAESGRVVAGTFDSVFVAPGLLVVWDKNEWGRFIGRSKPVRVKA